MISSVQELIERDEGRKLWPYKDGYGKPTWGVGHLLADPLTPDVIALLNQAIDLQFQHDLGAATDGLMAHLPWFASVNPIRQAVLIDMAFNLGVAGLMTFTTFLSCMESGQWAAAAADLRGTLVYRQLPGRYERLATMIHTGQWPS